MLLSEIYDKPNQELFEYWAYQQYWCEDHNKDWFDALLVNPKYEKYWVLRDDDTNDIAAFSCIQFVEFPEYTCRIGTRTFIDPEYRNKSSSRETQKITPMFRMLTEQYNWVKENTDKENCFSSMEKGRTAAMRASARKFKTLNDVDAEVLPYRYKMFNNTTHPSCYQQVLLFPIKSKKFELNWIIS